MLTRISNQLPVALRFSLYHCYLKGLKHVEDREMTIRDLRVLIAVMTLVRVEDQPGGAKVAQIVGRAGMSQGEVLEVLPALVASGHIHEDVPLFGDRFLYRLGPKGWSFAKSLRDLFEPALIESVEMHKEALAEVIHTCANQVDMVD